MDRLGSNEAPTGQLFFRGAGVQNTGQFHIAGDLNIHAHNLSKYDSQMLAALKTTDPRHDKERIKQDKGGLLKDAYRWILNHEDFQRWRHDNQNRLLWIKGDPGKGKTMLLCGIVDELDTSKTDTNLLAFFFCQAADQRINSAAAVLRGLIYLLVDQHPPLLGHVRKQYDSTGKLLFEGANAWIALSQIFADIVQDPSIGSTCLVVDALDECVTDLQKLLGFINQSSSSPRVKWIVSSRNWPSIEERLACTTQKAWLCLELNPNSISAAVETYIQHKVSELTKRKRYPDATRDAVQNYLLANANNTFLWVALVCQELDGVSSWNVKQKLAATTYPAGLDALYKMMMGQIQESQDAKLCKDILAVTLLVYQPITTAELESLADLPDGVSIDVLPEIIKLCGSFLTLQERTNTISFIHQSAKDFLLKTEADKIFPLGKNDVSYSIFSRSVQIMFKTLQRDIYGLGTPGFFVEQVKPPSPNPLMTARYSCLYWVDHLHDCDIDLIDVELREGGSVHLFLRQKYLYWLEALSLLHSLSKGILSMTELQASLQGKSFALANLVKDQLRFVRFFKWPIENYPLQVYASGLMFSPRRCLTRKLFQDEQPDWISLAPIVDDNWSQCLQTLEGHTWVVHSVAFSPDGALVASAADDSIRIWDVATGRCCHTLDPGSSTANSLTFFSHGAFVAAAAEDSIRVWDSETGRCCQTLLRVIDHIRSFAFSPDGSLVVAATDNSVRIWDVAINRCRKILFIRRDRVNSVVFSPDGTFVALGMDNETIEIRDAAAIDHCRHIFTTNADKNYDGKISEVMFSPNGALVASSTKGTIWIWDISTGRHSKIHVGFNKSVVFSPNGKLIASTYVDAIRILDAATGEYCKTLASHHNIASCIAFSPDSALVATGAPDYTVQIWDVSMNGCQETIKDHDFRITCIAFSPDGTRVASGSYDSTVRIWDAATGRCRKVLERHKRAIYSVAFSPDGTLVASGSINNTVRIWNATTGRCCKTFEGHMSRAAIGHTFESVAFSSDGTLVASGCSNGAVLVWDIVTGRCRETPRLKSKGAPSVAFSPDGTLVAASGYFDKAIRIWDTATGRCHRILDGHSEVVQAVAFSPDGALIAAASSNDTIRIWDATTGCCCQTIEIGAPCTQLSFDNTGKRFRTDVGIIDIPAADTEASASLIIDGYGISADKCWITRRGDNLVWLPAEFRPKCLAIFGSTVVIVCRSGRCLIMRFDSSGELSGNMELESTT